MRSVPLEVCNVNVHWSLDDGPNPEYPWPADAPTATPVEFTFPIWEELTETSYGRKLILLIHNLFGAAEEYM